MTYVEANRLDSTRPSDPIRAWRLDREGGEGGRRTSAVVFGLVGGVMAGVVATPSAIVGLGIWAAYGITTRYRAQDVDGAAVLRRVLPIRRRDVITARCLETGVLVALFVVALLAVLVPAVIIRGDEVGELLFSMWLTALTFAAALLVGLRAAVTCGPVVVFLIVFAVGMAALLLALALWSAFLGEDYGIRSGAEAVTAVVSLVLVLGVGIPLSHHCAVRAYDRKDL